MTVAAPSGARAQSQAEKTFVLVHGAWHGGWCWRRVAHLLQQRGHKVFTPTLTGLGERSHLISDKIDLATHIADVVQVIKWEELDNFVLCGHSYGGFVISGVAERVQSSISSIVYLDAFLPDNGENLASSSERLNSMVTSLKEKGQTVVPPIPAAVFKVNDKDRDWVDRQCTPQPILTFTDRVVLTGARDRIAKKAYVRAKGYASPVFDAAFNRVKDNSSWRKLELPCGHDAMLDMPERVAEILVECA